MQAQQRADQAADNLSVSNAVTSLRAIGDADWPDIVARSSALMRLMLGSPVFEAEHTMTRDQTLHGIERLARHGRAQRGGGGAALLALMHEAEGSTQATGGEHSAAVASHWLPGAGRPALMRALGLHGTRRRLWRAAAPARGAAGSTWARCWSARSAWWPGCCCATARGPMPADPLGLMLAGRRADAVPGLGGGGGGDQPADQRIGAAARTCRAWRWRAGIPARAPGDGGDPGDADRARRRSQALVHRLQLHHLANPERQAQFALLTDWADADSARARHRRRRCSPRRRSRSRRSTRSTERYPAS